MEKNYIAAPTTPRRVERSEADRVGVSLKNIQHWLGHKDPRTTERYIRAGQELDKSPAYAIRYGG